MKGIDYPPDSSGKTPTAMERAFEEARKRKEEELQAQQEKLGREVGGQVAEAIIKAGKEGRQEKISRTYKDVINTSEKDAPQYGHPGRKVSKENLHSMQKEMDLLHKRTQETVRPTPEQIPFPNPQDKWYAYLIERSKSQFPQSPIFLPTSVAQEPQKLLPHLPPVAKESVVANESILEEKVTETPLETHNRLKELIARVQEKLSTPPEALTQAYTRSAEYFDTKLESLNKKLENLGIKAQNLSFKDVWGGTVKIGEEYRKAGLAYKLGLAATLLGTGAFVGFAGAGGAGIIAAGIATQRALSSLGTYALVDALMERRLARKGTYTKTERYVKHGAAIGAGGAMLFGIPGALLAEGLDAVDAQEKLDEWLGRMLDHGSESAPVPALKPMAVIENSVSTESPTVQNEEPLHLETEETVREATPIPSESDESINLVGPLAPIESATAQGEPPAVPETQKIPDIRIEAEKGRGYEWMLKRLAERLPNDFVLSPDMRGTDIEKLFEAKQSGTLDTAVHKLAAAHGAFIEDEDAGGTSKIVKLGDVITLGEDGNIELNGGGVATTLEGRGVTPPWPPVPPEASVVETPPAPEVAVTPEIPANVDAQTLTETPVSPTEPVPTAMQESSPPAPDDADTSDSIESVETPSPTTTEYTTEFINKHNLHIDPLKGHVFQNADGLALAFGNDFDARFEAAQKFAIENPGVSVWVQAEKPVAHEGQLIPWVMEIKYKRGFFGIGGGMQIPNPDGPPDPRFMGTIDSDTFIKQLK